MYQVIDTNVNTTKHLPRLKEQGVTTIIRYYSHDFKNEKVVKAAEAAAIREAGLRLGVVYESNGDHAGAFGEASGRRDAQATLDCARVVGQPLGSTVWFAVDFDCTDADRRTYVWPYFLSIAAILKDKYDIGVYGSGATCIDIFRNGWASKTWISCSSGWMSSMDWFNTGYWDMRQHIPTKDYAGIDTDPNEVNPGHDIGDFIPGQPNPGLVSSIKGVLG